jgi:lathosterol oxidase
MSQTSETPNKKTWNYHPDLPLKDGSIFVWPPRPSQLLQWFFTHWLVLSERVLIVGLAILMWAFAYPSIDQAATFAFGWVAQVWLINLVLMMATAGGLHLVVHPV